MDQNIERDPPYFYFQCKSESISKTKSYPFEKKSIRFRFDFIRQKTKNEVRYYLKITNLASKSGQKSKCAGDLTYAYRFIDPISGRLLRPFYWKTHPIVNWRILGRHTCRFTGKLIHTKCYISYMVSVKKIEWMSFPVKRSV